jgi:cytochrome d ubiquinol oxidase subunit II
VSDPTTLQIIWFLLISILWLGYFVLEGFDFGVGMLLRRIGRTESEKRAVIHTIGPVWDGNEVWLLTAGGATFAAFPELYATLFSGFYIALFLILAALIVRGMAFEMWGKEDDPRWKAGWEWGLAIGSFLPALLWGVAWASIVGGVPLDAAHEYDGTLFDLLTPYALLGGAMSLSLFLAHGAQFLRLRLKGEIHDRAEHLARLLTPIAGAFVVAFALATVARQSGDGGVEVVSAILLAGAVLAAAATIRQPPAAVVFGLTTAMIVLTFTGLFAELYPAALVSDGAAASTLTLSEAASTEYTLKVMTGVAVLFLPIVLAYQYWTYRVFRARLGAEDFQKNPLDLLPGA